MPGPNGLSCLADVTLPTHVLRGPWTKDKVGLLRRLLHWGASLHPQDDKACCEGMGQAVIEGNPEALRFLLKARGSYHRDLLRLVAVRGTDSAMADLLSKHERRPCIDTG